MKYKGEDSGLELFYAALGIFSFIAICVSLPFIVYNNSKKIFEYRRKYEEAYQRVVYLADIDKDGITTKREWRDVYRTIGKKTDSFKMAPRRDLSLGDLEEFLYKKSKPITY